MLLSNHSDRENRGLNYLLHASHCVPNGMNAKLATLVCIFFPLVIFVFFTPIVKHLLFTKHIANEISLRLLPNLTGVKRLPLHLKFPLVSLSRDGYSVGRGGGGMSRWGDLGEERVCVELGRGGEGGKCRKTF